MNHDEAIQLLARAAAFDNRKPSSAAAHGWAAALADVPLDQDALDAVTRYYGSPTDDNGRRWIEPGHVRAIRKQIRAARIGETLPAYVDPDPDEGPSEFVRRRREQLAAIGNGTLQPVPIRQLTGGPAKAVAKALKGVGRKVPDEDDGPAQPPADFREKAGLRTRPPELAVPCPRCKAQPGDRCHAPSGRELRDTHPSRRDHGATT